MSTETLIAASMAVLAALGLVAWRLRARRPAALPGGQAGKGAAGPAATSTPTTAGGGPTPASPSSGAPSSASPWAGGLAKTRSGWIQRLSAMLGSRATLDDAMAEEMEATLLGADLGVRTTERLLARLREQLTHGLDASAAWEVLEQEALAILDRPAAPLRLDAKPSLILIVGVNGAGKTTTIGKLARHFTAEGRRVLLAAGDTFRAAAVEQLEAWGRRAEVPVVRGAEGADPGAVIFDAVKRAREEGADLVIADTAGRLHTRAPLMDELKKVVRTAEKALGRAPDEVLLVLDATNGQNALQQARMFGEAIGLTGVVLTKLDGTAKGGVTLAIAEETGLPVRFVGVGERADQLEPFRPEGFVQALFDRRGLDGGESAPEH